MKRSIAKLAVTISATAILSGAWALDEDRPAGATFYPEQSSEQVAAQQAYQGRIEASGVVPIRTDEQQSIPLSRDQAATAALSVADRRQRGAENLLVAESRLKDPKGKRTSPWWFAVLLAGVGLVGYVGLKDWVTKNIPAMPSIKRKKRRKSSL